MWDDIARTHARRKNNRLLFGRFNCEESLAHGRLCNQLKIDRYPAFAFIGYGNMRQGNGRVALFEGPLTPENIREWVHLLSYLSYFQRLFNVTVRSSIWPFGLDKLWRRDSGAGDNGSGRSPAHTSTPSPSPSSSSRGGASGSSLGDAELSLGEDGFEQAEAEEEEEDLELDLSRLRNYGDVFKELHDTEPDPSNLALRSCVGAVAHEYCIYAHDKRGSDGSFDAYCRVLEECNRQQMRPAVCRPAVCPLDQAGCALVSMCLLPEVLEQYQELLEEHGFV